MIMSQLPTVQQWAAIKDGVQHGLTDDQIAIRTKIDIKIVNKVRSNIIFFSL